VSYAALLVHPLAIVTPTNAAPAAVDDYGQPVPGTPTTTLVQGMVQPKTAQEVALTSQGGAEIGDFTIFLPSMRLSGAAYIRDEPDGGRRFEIVGVRSLEFGSVPHLEVDAKLVGSTEGPTVEVEGS
jgi:hypothetical protein